MDCTFALVVSTVEFPAVCDCACGQRVFPQCGNYRHRLSLWRAAKCLFCKGHPVDDHYCRRVVHASKRCFRQSLLWPFGFVLDIVDRVIPHKLFRLPAFLRNRYNKYGVGAGALAAASLTGTQAFCVICPIGGVCRSYGLNSVMAGAEAAIIPATAALNFGESRSWCRYFCPVGATLGLAAKFGLVRIEIGATRCKKFSCMRCATVCPMGIIPEEQLVQGISPQITMAECITCLRCVGACPHGAASIRFIWQKPRTRHGSLPCVCTKDATGEKA